MAANRNTSDGADDAERIELPDFADVMTGPPPRPVFALPAENNLYDMDTDSMAPDPSPARQASPARRAARPRKPSQGRASGPTPAQIAALLAKACSGSSMLLVAWLELEDAYVMSKAEAKAIAEPAARIIAREAKRNTAFGRLCRWLMQSLSAAGDGHGDAIALLFALYAYGARVYPAASASLAARSPSRPLSPLSPTAPSASRPRSPTSSAAGGSPHVRPLSTTGATQSRAGDHAGASADGSGGGLPFPSIAPGVVGYPVE